MGQNLRLVSCFVFKTLFDLSCILLIKIQLEWHHGYIARLLYYIRDGLFLLIHKILRIGGKGLWKKR